MLTDDTPGTRSNNGLARADSANRAFDARRNAEKRQWLRLAWLPIPALIVSMAAIYFAVTPNVSFEPAWLLPITNMLFVTAVCFVVAYVAMRNYSVTGRVQILLLGCGLLSFGLGGAIAGWVRSVPGAGPNLNVTIYNTAALLGGMFHFFSAFILLAGISPQEESKHKKLWLVFSCTAITSFMALFTAASLRGFIPPFFIQGVGPTAVRQMILGSAAILFAFSFLIFMGWYLRKGEVFLYWYSSALALTAISLSGFFIQSAVGSPIGWVSRFSQYLGGIYFLIAVATAIRTAHVRKTSLDNVITDSLSPSEEKFRALAENSPDIIGRFDRELKHIYVNPPALRLYGKPPDAIIGKTIEETGVAEPYCSLWKERLQKVFAIGQPMQVEDYFPSANGMEFFQSHCVPEFAVDGTVANVLIVSRNLTERKQAEEALQESEGRFRSMYEHAAVGIEQVAVDGRLLMVNAALCHMLGYSEGELRSKTYEEITHAEDRNREAPLLDAMRRGERDFYEIEKRCLHRDGSPVWVNVTSSPVKDAAGKLLYRISIIQDITERKRVEEALRESEERFRSMYGKAAVGIQQLTNDGRLLMVNAALCRMLGYSKSELLGRTVMELTHPDDLARDAALLEPVLRGESDLFEAEKRYLHRDGSPVWVHVTSSVVKDASGRPLYRIAIVQDVSERKRAEQALLRSEKLATVGRMAATIAHEINNPLAAVMNALFIAKGLKGLPESARQYLDMAEAELKRIAHITRQSLGFYRESNAPALTSVNAVLESAVDLLKSKIKAKHAVIEKQWDEDVEVTAVAGELRQVFSNLLANSLEAIDEKGTIKLRVSTGAAFKNAGRWVRITVADDGRGISASLLPHIFEPFFTTKGTIGTGLGLWVSKEIIDKHGGAIRVRSSSNGARRSTVFSIFLPVEPAVAARSQSAET
jgi:PAS domain S-box-containing protein